MFPPENTEGSRSPIPHLNHGTADKKAHKFKRLNKKMLKGVNVPVQKVPYPNAPKKKL